MSIATNLLHQGVVMYQVSRIDAKSRELARAGCGCCSAAAACVLVPWSPLFCQCRSSVFLCLFWVGLLQIQTGSWGETDMLY